MKNKKYYYVKLYQISKYVKNIKEGTIVGKIIDTFDDIPTVESSNFEEIDTIIVEKVYPFHVKEINTGILFPIINLEIVSSYINPIYYIEHPLYQSNTFVLSKSDKILGKEITSSKELIDYHQKHPNTNEFQLYLKNLTNKNNQSIKTKKFIKQK